MKSINNRNEEELMKEDVNYRVLRIIAQVSAAYIVIRMAVDFANENYEKMAVKSIFLLFIGVVYFVTKRKLDQESE